MRNLLLGAAQKFDRDSQAWGLAWRQALVIAVIPIIVVLVMTAMVPYFNLFVWVTAEDSLIEWAQFLLLLASSLLFARLGAGLIRAGQRLGFLYLLLALGIFFIAGEEIAWGQRILGWETPQSLGEINYQNETTLHNIGLAHQGFIYAIMLGGMYGTIAPLLWHVWRGERQRSLLSYLLVPPVFLVPAFLMPFAYRLTRLLLPLEGWFPHLVFPITKFSEVTELCLYFGLLVFAWLNQSHLYSRQPRPWSAEGSWRGR